MIDKISDTEEKDSFTACSCLYHLFFVCHVLFFYGSFLEFFNTEIVSNETNERRMKIICYHYHYILGLYYFIPSLSLDTSSTVIIFKNNSKNITHTHTHTHTHKYIVQKYNNL